MAVDNRSSQSAGPSEGICESLAVRKLTMPADEMWKCKRERQRADIEGLKSGALTADAVSWFAGGIARNARIVGSLV